MNTNHNPNQYGTGRIIDACPNCGDHSPESVTCEGCSPADRSAVARYESGAQLKHITHYVLGSARPAVCGTTTDGSGVYADEHKIPSSLCRRCSELLTR